MLKKLLVIMFVGIFLVACDKGIEEQIGSGEFNNNSYTNEYLDISITLPNNWVIADTKKRKQILENGGKELEDDDFLDKLSKKVSLSRTRTLFSSSKAELLSDKEIFSPSIIGLGEKLGVFGGKEASEYLRIMKSKLLESEVPYQFSQDSTYKQSGMIFETLSGRIEGEEYLRVNQEYYVTRIKDYMLVIIISYIDDEDKKAMMDSLKTLKNLSEQKNYK